MNNRLTLATSAIAISLLLNTVTVRADDAQTLKRIDEQLAKLKTFEYGQDGNPARDLEQIIFQLPAKSNLRGAIEQKLADALDNSNDIARGIICRQLRAVGTDACVPAVVPLLSDQELSPFARYALQGIGSAVALEAMHNALAKVPGRLQVGILNSLAERRYQPMRDDCVRLLSSEDPAVAAVAIRALGRLGGSKSADALTRQRNSAVQQLAGEIDLALLDCAEGLLNEGDTASAAAIYSTLYRQNGAFRLAGLRGLVATQPGKAADLLVDAMRQDDRRLAASAANLTTRATGAKATGKFVAALGELPDERRLLLIKSLGVRGDAAAVPAVAAAARSSSPEIRVAAVDALGGLKGDQAVDALLAAALDNDHSVLRVARASLARIDGADAHLVEVASNADGGVAMEAIHALAGRQAKGTIDLMLQLAGNDNRQKRAAAIAACGVLADSRSVASLVELALNPKSMDDLPEIESSLARVLMRVKIPAERANPLLVALPEAGAGVRPVLVRQLARAGTKDALDAVRDALKSSDAKTSQAAVTALADWPNPTAAGDLIPLIEAAPAPELKKQALEGYVRVAAASDNPSAMFLDALRKVRSLENQKRVLNEIGLNCESFEAIETTQSLFGSPKLAAVAGIATVRIAYKLRLQHKEKVREILENVLAQVKHPDVQKRAQDVLNDLDKYQDHILQWVAIGPFVDRKITAGEQSYKTAFEPEKADASALEWEPLTLGIGSWDINLEAAYGAKDHCSAYVRTMIWSPADQAIQVEGGSDDALKIWVNGRQVHEQWRTGGCEPRQVLVPARLNEGWNELKLKVTDHEGGWQFGCRIRKPDGTRLEGLKYEAR